MYGTWYITFVDWIKNSTLAPAQLRTSVAKRVGEGLSYITNPSAAMFKASVLSLVLSEVTYNNPAIDPHYIIKPRFNGEIGVLISKDLEAVAVARGRIVVAIQLVGSIVIVLEAKDVTIEGLEEGRHVDLLLGDGRLRVKF